MQAIFFLLLTLSAGLYAQTLRGRVLDGSTGEPVAGVRVSVSGRVTRSDDAGRFVIETLAAGRLTLQMAAVNYGLLKQEILLPPAGLELDVRLHQDAGTIVTRVDVTGAPFEGVDGPAAPSVQTLSKNEIQSMGTLFVADPLRAVQALPSISTTNDARGEISIRGSSFSRVGVLVDGILVDGFLHQAQGDMAGNESDRASFSILSTDRIAGVNVLSGAFPSRYGQRSAGIVALETREGNLAKPDFRFTTGFLLGTSVVLDGPLANKKASYLIGVRSSLADYLSRLATPAADRDTSVFNDGQVKLTYQVTPRHKLTANSFFGAFRDELKSSTARPEGRNTATRTGAFSLAAILSWDWTARPKLFVETKAFHLETNLRLLNDQRQPLLREPVRQWGGRQDWMLQKGAHQISWGTYLRRIDGEGFGQLFSGAEQRRAEIFEQYRGRTQEQNFYAQDTYRIESAQLSFTGGVRVERNSLTKETYADPRLAMAWGSSQGWQLRLGYGRHRQFPDLSTLLSLSGNRSLRAELTHHTALGLGRSLGSRGRIIVELFERRDRAQVFALDEPRLFNGRLAPVALPLNSVNGRARGLEVMLQRRSANRFSGFVSYAYLFTTLTEGGTGLRFPADADQRHAGRVAANYRLGANWNLSSVWRYGSGQPLTGFLVRRGADYFLASERNAERLPAYSRLDLRLSKAFSLWRTRSTFSIEGVNLQNRRNLSFAGITRVDQDGRVADPTTFFLGRFVTLGVTLQF